MNSFTETSHTREITSTGSTSGFMTKFQVAKELGMDAGSDDFKTVIEEVPCDDDWDVQNLMERAFSKAGLKRYHWDMKLLKSQSTSQEHSEEVESSSAAKKGKTNLFDDAERVSTEMNIVINHPEWHKAQGDAKCLQTFSDKIQTVSSDLKHLISEYASVAKPDATTMARKADLESQSRLVFAFELEISDAVCKALALDKDDAEGNNRFCDFLETKRQEIVSCVDASVIAIKKAQSFLDSL